MLVRRWFKLIGITMAVPRKHRDVAHRAATRIRDHWKYHHNAHLFYKPDVKVNFETGEITSDMKNG